MSRPFLSILIPTRNRAEYVGHSIQSALNIDSSDLEIIVSENHSDDDSAEVLQSFSDPRLRVMRPAKPLPMHDNWEYLLKQAAGEWVYFLGDDDAMMRHCVDHLKYLNSKYSACEAIVSQRAHFYWPGSTAEGNARVTLNFGRNEIWKDSKVAIDDCLNAREIYLTLPQFYSGGFQKRSLIKRVIESQGGHYFRSVTPDAYSALMGCIHTAKYLYSPVPMTWVGFSPHRANSVGFNGAKDREKDFWGLFDQGNLTMHPAMGQLKAWTFPLVFFEAYISAIPITSYAEFTNERIFQLFKHAVREFESRGDFDAAKGLADYLSFPYASDSRLRFADHLTSVASVFAQVLRRCCNKAKYVYRNRKFRESVNPVFYFETSSSSEFLAVSDLDPIVETGLKAWLETEYPLRRAVSSL
jgi:glycosyltransferase involved in cell wall biosynthesis